MKTLFFALLSFASSVFAIPQIVNYQGQLTSPSGSPLDTTVAISFSVYSELSGGVAAWTEVHPAVVVTGGLFSVTLGSIASLNDLFDVNRWLGITIGSDTEMLPREQIVSVAHAFRVGTVDGASGGVITGDVRGTAKGNIWFWKQCFRSCLQQCLAGRVILRAEN